MANQTINIGVTADDGTGDTLRNAGTKMNANFVELYGMEPRIGSLEQKIPSPVSAKTASYTAVAGDSLTFFTINVASANTFTVPANAPVGWECAVFQIGTGQTTISATGGNLRHPDSHTKISKQYGMVYLKVYANAGNAPQVAFTGDTAL